MTDAIRHRTLSLLGGEVAFLDFGDFARPVDLVWCHATGFNAETYLSTLAPLAADLRILALDSRGHGRTTLPADPAALQGWVPYAYDLEQFLDAAGIAHPVVLGGHSMGGATCLIAADRLGARVKGLALFDPVIVPRMASFIRYVPGLEQLMGRGNPMASGALRRKPRFASREAAFSAYHGRGPFRTWPDEVLAGYVEAGFRETGDGVTLACTPEWEAATFMGATAQSLWPVLGRVSCPIQVFKARERSTCYVPDNHRLAIQSGRVFQTVEGTTHFLPIERPDLVREAVRDMCAG